MNLSAPPSGDLCLVIPIDRAAPWYHLLDFILAELLAVFFFLPPGSCDFAPVLFGFIVFMAGSVSQEFKNGLTGVFSGQVRDAQRSAALSKYALVSPRELNRDASRRERACGSLEGSIHRN